jgi:hypothetical protein
MSTPLKNLLEYVEGEVWRSDETGVVMIEMARRLRKLDERHSYVEAAEGGLICQACLTYPCPDRQILNGKD